MIISRKIKATILSVPGAWFFLIPLRLFNVYNEVLKKQIVRLIKWGLSSREFTNFSYHSSQITTKRLASMLGRIEGVSPQAIAGYCAELERASVLQDLYREARQKEGMLRNLTDKELRAGRQIVYYCLTRALKPKVVFEAGTAHGKGALLILHALKLNAAEGFPGELTTVDLNPNAGKLLKYLPSGYRSMLNFIVDTSEDTLRDFPGRIDLFFHDTMNLAAHEQRHYALLRQKISRNGVICTSWGMAGLLAEFAAMSGRQYLEFTVQPDDHWTTDTLGISLPAMLRVPSAYQHPNQFVSDREISPERGRKEDKVHSYSAAAIHTRH
jgi:predicted O-methyltransferase YrrM